MDPNDPKFDEKVEQIARVCHEANRAYCINNGDTSQLGWDDTPADVKQVTIKGVKQAILDPDLTPELSHTSWRMEKVSQGWVYGPNKDDVNKTHPNMVGYASLPEVQRTKDALFLSIIHALA